MELNGMPRCWNTVPGDYGGDGLADPAVRKTDGSEWRVMLG